jgi:surfactin synthase thioesterase subunit
VPFAKAFSADVKRVAVSYPGAQGTPGVHSGTAIPSITALADNIERMLTPARESGVPIAFFGHSMGALVAFEVARRFEGLGTPISALFVSASTAPGLMRDEYYRDMSDDDLMRFLVDLAGMDPKVLDNKEFVDTITPALRGYYSAIAGYEPGADAAVSCPIYAFTGSDDGLAPKDNVAAWASHTTSGFALRVLDGDHFYFVRHIPAVAGDVETRFAAARDTARPEKLERRGQHA